MATSSTKIITPKCVLSYPHLAEPQPPMEDGNGKAMYGAALVFVPGPEQDAFRAQLDAAIAEAGSDFFGQEKWKTLLANPSTFTPLKSSGKPVDGQPAGTVFVNARNERQPGMVYAHAAEDGKPAAIATEDIVTQLYPGAVVRASVRVYAFRKTNKLGAVMKQGVSIALNNIQKLADGKRLDDRVAARDEFTADLAQAPANLDDIAF